MEIGSYIKLHRIKQEMTQAELAEGIVSFAYLSKIENGKTEASPEVISLLCTRLGIQLDNEKDITIKNKCQEWYSQLFEVNDKDEIERGYNELEALMEDTHSESMVMFEIHKIRYFLILGQYEAALTQINSLADLSSTFDSLHQFYWYKFKGNYNSQVGEFNQAMRMYKLAEEKLNHLELAESEIADLQYTISVTHSKLRNTLDSIEYANKALDVFQRNYNFLRCAQCHILLGISYRRLMMYEKAIKNYNLALHLGKLNNNRQLIQLTNQNLGNLYSTKGEAKQAIQYFGKIVDDDKVILVERLAAIACLIREYYNVEQYDKAKGIIEKGLSLMKDLDDIEPFRLLYYMIYTYHFALGDDHEKFENLVINEFIPYLKKHKDYANLVTYAELMGQHYERLYRYKDATKFYKQANLAYEQFTNI
ncbi:helix-turn-helix domain-containing protein [Virgibacillus dakarensis]|uniref:helix-turn-helix domain-containing protein n=1 Tax=Virgibacillus dakarensis TaxID=1917889 RepID=UPI000B431980|nr:helix-turn-helix domain-containing protein [Virgibacillus dakarensis]